MDSGFRRYDPSDGDSEDLGILEIYVHHARNIHNICIYDDQDVYAKFSLTYNPDQTHSTRVIKGGGKNPEFNQKLAFQLTQLDAVLKCEIWMLSRVRNYLEDQLLGFALVPISQFLGKGKVTQDYSLSSTDLFHSPAGTVKLSLSLNSSPSFSTALSSSISGEVVLLGTKVSDAIPDPFEYSRIEFPDMDAVSQNHQMVFEFLDSKPCSFLRLGAFPHHLDDGEMTASSNDQNSGFFTSTSAATSNDQNSSDSIEKKNLDVSISAEVNHDSNSTPDTPTSKKGGQDGDNKGQEAGKDDLVIFGQTFVSSLGNDNMEAEQSTMQKQIVEMYMKSMQQFTESLDKMKLPMDIDNPENEDSDHLIQSRSHKLEIEKKKSDGSRVFYGSRAFF